MLETPKDTYPATTKRTVRGPSEDASDAAVIQVPQAGGGPPCCVCAGQTGFELTARFKLCACAVQEPMEMRKMETSVSSTIPAPESGLEIQGRAASMPRLNIELQVTRCVRCVPRKGLHTVLFFLASREKRYPQK